MNELKASRTALLFLAGLACTAFATATYAETPINFGEIVRISPAGRLAMSPDIAVDTSGRAHVLWVDKGADGTAPPPTDPSEIKSGPGVQHHAFDDLYYRQFSLAPAGTSMSEPVRVNSEPGEVWGFSVSKPQISVAPDAVPHVLFTGNKDLGEGKSSVIARYTRSTNNGRSFEPVRTLNSTASNDLSAVMHGGFAAAHAFGTLLATTNGDINVYWIDTRLMNETDTAGAIFVARSSDGGKQFASDRQVFGDRVCPCCQLSAVETDDTVFLSSRRVFEGGYRDTTIAISNDEGESFAEPVRIGDARWKIEGCPLKRADVAANGKFVHTASYTQGRKPKGVYLTRSTDGGASYEEATPIHTEARISDSPSISADSEGRVYLVWHAKTTGPRRLYLRVSDDNGASYSPAVEVPTAEGNSAYPEIAAGSGGTAYLVWEQSSTVYLLPISTQPQQVASAH